MTAERLARRRWRPIGIGGAIDQIAAGSQAQQCRGPEKEWEQASCGTTIFVGNLDYKAGVGDIWRALEQVGKVKDVQVLRDWATGWHKGCALATFATHENKMHALRRGRLVVGSRCARLLESHVELRNLHHNGINGPERQDNIRGMGSWKKWPNWEGYN